MSEVSENKIGNLVVRIDRSACIGSGNCVKVAPEVFELDEESLATFAGGSENADREKTVEGCRVCPVDALSAHDDSGAQLAP